MNTRDSMAFEDVQIGLVYRLDEGNLNPMNSVNRYYSLPCHLTQNDCVKVVVKSFYGESSFGGWVEFVSITGKVGQVGLERFCRLFKPI